MSIEVVVPADAACKSLVSVRGAGRPRCYIPAPLRLPQPAAASKVNILADFIDKRAWSGVLDRLKTHPDEARRPIRHGYHDESLPLHEACKLQPPTEVVIALLSAHPSAVRTPGGWSNLPLHSAARTDSTDAVDVLIKEYPGAARRKDDAGKLPLHVACQWGACPHVVESLLRMYPEGICVRDDENKTPMDYANALKEKFVPKKSEIIKVMGSGAAYCVVSKTAYARVKEELDTQARALNKAHAIEISNLERKHAEDIALSRRLEEGVRESLRHVGNDAKKQLSRVLDLEKKMALVENELEISRNAEDVLKAHADTLEKNLKQKEGQLRDAEIMIDTMKKNHQSFALDLEKKMAAIENELKISRNAEDTLKAHADTLEKNLKEKKGQLRDAEMKINIAKSRIAELASMESCFEKMKTEVAVKARVIEAKEAELINSNARAAVLSRNLVDAARRDDRNIRTIDALKKSILSLSASVSALTSAKGSIVDRAIEEKERALKLIFLEDNSMEQQRLSKQQENLTSEIESLEKSLRFAEPPNDVGSFWDEIGYGSDKVEAS